MLLVFATAGWIKKHTHKLAYEVASAGLGKKNNKKEKKSKTFPECLVEIYHYSNMWASWLNYCKTNKFILPSALLGKWQPAHPCKSSSVGAHLLGEVSAGSCLVEPQSLKTGAFLQQVTEMQTLHRLILLKKNQKKNNIFYI